MAAQFHSLLRLALVILVLGGVAERELAAQGRRGFDRGRGGPGTFGPPAGGGGIGGPPGFDVRSSLGNVVRSESVQAELTLSESQRTALEELSQDDAMRNVMRDFGERIRNTESEAERIALQAEMAQAIAENNRQREEKIRGILDAKQFARLQQVSLQRAGTAALLRDDVAEDLKLDAGQRESIKTLNDEYNTARFQLGRGSDEDRQKLRDEYNGKILAILNASQREAWTAKLGPPAPEETSRGSFGGPPPTGGRPPVAAAAAAPPPRPALELAPPEGATVVSSFGAPSGEIGDRSEESANISFNFRYAPWVDVLKLFADRAGFTLDLNEVPPGTFNYYDDGKYTVTQALDILNGYLLPKGFVLVRRDRFLVCISVDRPIPPNLVPHVNREELYKRGLNELLTVVFSLESANINELVTEIGQLQVQPGKVVGLNATNSIAVTDIGSNLRRIDELLRDVSLQPETLVMQAYPLKYIAADEAETSVRALLGLQVGVTDISAGNDSRYSSRSSSSSSSSDRSRSDSSRSSPPPGGSSEPARIWAHLRTNTLMVTATPAQQKIVDAAIRVIDVDADDSNTFARSRKPYLHVYEVQSSDPREVVKTLSVLIPGVVVNEDARNGKIHIVATETQHEEVSRLIRQLDGMGGGEQVAVIPLVKMDPITAAAQLRTMFVRDGESAPTIEPDLYGRQLMIRGSSTQLLQAQQILAKLGEDGTGQRRPGEGGVLRTFPLSGRDPAELLPLLQQAWQNTAPNPIRIVPPRSRGPVNSILTPGSSTRNGELPFNSESERGNTDLREGEPSASLPGSTSRLRNTDLPIHFVAQVQNPSDEDSTPSPPPGGPRTPLTDAEFDQFLDQVVEAAASTADPPAGAASEVAPETPAGDSAPRSRPASNPDAPVTITILGDELLITGADPESLDRMEELLESVMQTVPPRTSWTIFPLENSDVTTTAAMLSQLFPETDVTSADSLSGGGSSLFGSLTSGISSMTNSLGSMSGLSGATAGRVRLIPYPPDNSLFVSGPTYKVEEIYEMLKILDSGELSASLRERTPRMIPVMYADIDEVYTVVRDVYKDLLENEQDRGARQAANMFASMMGGGGRRSGGQQESQAAQLTVGIDRQTSNLIVSSSEARYQEIKSLVESLDNSALQARRTVRVVSLHNTSASQLTNTISSLMPRVKVSSTGGRSSSSSSSSSSGTSSSVPSPSSGGDSSRSRSESDDMRRMFEQRMRERMQQMGGGGDSGGRPSFGGDSGGRPSFGGRSGSGGSPFGSSPFGGSRGGSDRSRR